MSTRYDTIIIGAGIIGACTAFELARRGWRTLNVDRLPAAGYGSTGSSCAIIRTHYSTSTARRSRTRATSVGTTGSIIWACATSASSHLRDPEGVGERT